MAAVIIFLGYLVAADAGNALAHSIAPTLIWPAAGVALAGAYLAGVEAIVAIFLAEFVFIFFVVSYPLPVALALGAASALQAGEAAWLLRRFSFHSGFARLADAYVFIGVAIVSAAIVPTIGVGALIGAHVVAWSDASARWGSWYVGVLVSLVVVGTLLLRWLPKLSFTRSRRDWIEIGVSLALALALALVVFATPYGNLGGIPLLYLLLLPLFWIALRLGPRITTLALAMTALIAVVSSIARFPRGTLPAAIFAIELLIVVLALIFIVTMAIAEERKDATATLRRQLGRLEILLDKVRGEDEAKNDFIALLAHELRNPLAPLLSSLELVRLTEADQRTKSAVNAMRGRVRTMARLLDDLLDLSRIERRSLSLAIERADLVAIAGRAAETAEPLWKERRQRFTARFPDSPLEIEGDPVRLEQVIVNLLTNASKYTGAGGQVTLALGREDGCATISVADTGVGILPEMLPQIFAPFSQGEPGKRIGGLGIGLALSRELVGMHHGSIEAKSDGLDRGSEFIVRLPLSAGGAAAPRRDRARELKRLAPASPLSILIIDDNRAAADALAALLAHVGHAVETAYDGVSGVKKAARGRPAAVILDIGLPDLSGYEVARELKEAGLEAPLIALTGFGQAEDRRKALAAGFSYHLVKPVGLADLEPVLREIAKKKKRPHGRSRAARKAA
jgi:signal transduction histidine kinase/CheY-like chemotaxis protein